MELVKYDPQNGAFTRKSSRGGSRAGSIAGCLREGYTYIQIDGAQIAAHRLAWLYVHGYLPDCEIDHVDRVRSNNRICNLRLATSLENQRNRTVRHDSASGAIGVNFDNRREKWRAYIYVAAKMIHLGYFADYVAAVEARLAGEKKYFGGFAKEAA